MKKHFFSLIFLCYSISFSQQIIIPKGAEWKYLDDGTDQGIAWIESGFDDSNWSSGKAELGYGDGDEVTLLSFGSNSSNKFITTYFRHKNIEIAVVRSIIGTGCCWKK